METDALAACAACDEDINPEVPACPECGNHPANKAKWASVGLMVVGVLLIWIPFIGIPLFIVGLIARLGIRFADYSPTKYAF